jgi:hypothetical protein
LFPALNAATVVRRRPGRLRGLLLSGQVAASFILLLLAGVLVRGVQWFDSINAGFDVDRIFDLKVEPSTAPVLARLRLQPGVAGVAALHQVPLYSRLNRQPAVVNGQSTGVAVNYVDENYFDVMELPIEQGRGFYRSEAEVKANVAVISDATARRFWPGQDALGATLTLVKTDESGESTRRNYDIIGVAKDVVNGWLFEGPERTMAYLPTHIGDADAKSAVVRLEDTRPAMVAAVREVCASFAESSGCDPTSLRSIAGIQRFAFQAAAGVATGLGLIALVLTAIGLYSVISYSVEQRRREIGVLVAIGATSSDVARQIIAEAARYFAIGIGCAVPVCLGLSYLSSSSLFRIQTFDLTAYLGVPALLAAIASLACLAPIRRALQVQPMIALRQD